MRAGGFTIQQALTPDAANIIKHAVTLARRRGHAQVTPLHVANTMLSSSTGLLRAACLQSNSHPLQCKALELCFNVALNRLPASSSGPILGQHAHGQHPSISNALVAAFKRAQAHQRRGSIENQQQPLLAVKIELEQLIISILDDPSVSRVMREAGFSSTQVKTNLEQAVNLELSASHHPRMTTTTTTTANNNNNTTTVTVVKSSPKAQNDRNSLASVRDEDVLSVIENLLMNRRRKKNLVVVGESVSTVEGVVGRVMQKVEKGDVPQALRDLKFVSFPLFSFGNLDHRGEVEQKIGELRSLVKGFVGKDVVLYLGDLRWISEYSTGYKGSISKGTTYCPLQHLVVELGRLVGGIHSISDGLNESLWIMGIASFQTYIQCTAGNPSLEIVWKLNPLPIPAATLSLSLIIPDHSDIQSECGSKKAASDSGGINFLMLETSSEEEKQLTCCADCSAKFESEAQSSRNILNGTTSSTLPSWLKDEKRLPMYSGSTTDQECLSIRDLCKKWNSICSSVHKQPSNLFERSLSFPSFSPSSSTSCFSYERQNPSSNQAWNFSSSNPRVYSKDRQVWDFSALDKTCEQSFGIYNPNEKDLNQWYPFSNPNSTPNSASSSEIMEVEYVQRFKEFNAENLKTLCNALEEKVPWQKDIIPDIAGTILQCRSGMIRRKGDHKLRSNGAAKEETWFFFQGIDTRGKEKIARELAKVVFGSHSSFASIALSNFSATLRADSTEDVMRNKRTRDEQSCSSYIERFADAVSANPHRVFLVEDVEQADYCSQMGIKRAIERGNLTNSSGEEIGLGDAVIVLSCESFSSRSRACSPSLKQKQDKEDSKKGLRSEPSSPNAVSLDLNISIDDDNDDDAAEEQSLDDIGLLEAVDRCIAFKLQEL